LQHPVCRTRGGPRNLSTPLKRPCNTLLDIQANRQELQRDLQAIPGLEETDCYVLQVLLKLYDVTALIERPVQMRLEAERARLEGRS
jgi:hypothetical protein